MDPVSFNLLLFLLFLFCFKMTKVLVLEKRINRRKIKQNNGFSVQNMKLCLCTW